LTPETISAAYARISRSPKPVDELRDIARAEVDKARQSNRNIVFEMGHSSVAEHAVFNIDVIGVSRLLVEEIEKFRLCSFTEKSQRYVLFNKDFVIPEEIKQANVDDLFVSAIETQNEYYHALYEKLRPYIFDKHKNLAQNPASKSMLEDWAKETINARNLELMLRRLAAHPLTEAKEYSEKLYSATKDIVPSLIRYTKATDYDKYTRENLRHEAQTLLINHHCHEVLKKLPDAQLAFYSLSADNKVAAAMLFTSSALDYAQCLSQVNKMNPGQKKSLFKTAFANLQAHDAVLREVENVDLLFELILSSSCFAQLKRHRMSTIIAQEYNPQLGVTLPPSIKAIGEQKAFMDIMRRTQKTYEQIKKIAPQAAAYVLTNAHRKRVLMKLNAREMYHLARLRADAHAQWDIRDLTQKMLKQAKKVMPLTLMMACGKDSFAKLYENSFPRG